MTGEMFYSGIRGNPDTGYSGCGEKTTLWWVGDAREGFSRLLHHNVQCRPNSDDAV